MEKTKKLSTPKQKRERNEKIMRWVKMTAFVLMIIGGINLLLMGLFNFNLIAVMFGGAGSVVSRICFSLFGLGALTLLTVVLVKAFGKDTRENKNEITKK